MARTSTAKKIAEQPALIEPAQVAERPDVKALTSETEQLSTLATTYVVKTTEQYEAAANDLQKIKGALKRLQELRLSITRPMDEAKKRIMDLFRAPEQKLQNAELAIKRAMNTFITDQARERERLQREQEERARKERERLQKQAEKAAAKGQTEKAAELEHRAETVVAPTVQIETPRVAGVQTREIWRFEIVDQSALPREYLMPDEKKIGGVVRALKGDTNIPGVRVWTETMIASGAA
jgi:exonuclease VII large subunit